MRKAPRPRRTRARLGQHFLRDPRVLDRIVDFFHPQKGDLVVEIGAGRGGLTRRLARALEPEGRLLALELDPALAAGLRREFSRSPHVSVIEADALTFDFSGVSTPETSGGEVSLPPIRAVGNLPYYAATAILLRLIGFRERVRDIVAMVQKEVAERIATPPGSKAYGTLSLAVQLWCRVEPGFEVGPKAFHPAPKVASAVLRLLPQSHPRVPLRDPGFFERVVRAAFAQRRKTLFNNLKARFQEEGDAGCVERALADCGIDPVRRAETLSLEEFARLSDRLGEGRGK